jgi:hypothetical protein
MLTSFNNATMSQVRQLFDSLGQVLSADMSPCLVSECEWIV